jgi:predicted GNAT family acetyltransferase
MTTRATSPIAPSISDDSERNRFVMRVPGGEAFATYRRANGNLVILHTEVPATLRGQGIGSELAAGVFEFARSKGEHIVPACSFLADWVRRHPEYRDVLAGKEAR